MARRMLINAQEPEESRVAVLEDETLQELYIHPADTEALLGNIYKARVLNVERSIQAAFVDIGTGRNAFLHVSDVRSDGSEGPLPTDGAKAKRRRDDTPIQDLLKKGQEVIVQVTKEPIGNKGPSATTYVSIPGRFLVMMPGTTHYGVSRKISDEAERKRLRTLLEELELPEKMGFIIRTAGNGARKSDLQRDLRYLKRLWGGVEDRIHKAETPALAYQESDIVIRCMRDIFAPDIEEIIIDSEEVARRASEFLRTVSPAHRKRVKLYRGAQPLFHKYGVEPAVQATFSNHVPLPSGGSIVIEPCEALVAIDVNSGKYTDEDDIEETAFRTNMEAAVEACRQLRLRDLGGVIIIDFIDMRLDKHRRKVERTVSTELKNDRARSRWLRVSRFGLMQITRQRVRRGTKMALYDPCPTCKGSGLVRSTESMVPHVMRDIRLAVARKNGESVEVTMHPDVAERLSNSKRRALDHIEQESHRTIRILADPAFKPGQCEVVCHLKGGKKLKI